MTNPFDLITIDSLAGIQIIWLALGGAVMSCRVASYLPAWYWFGLLVGSL